MKIYVVRLFLRMTRTVMMRRTTGDCGFTHFLFAISLSYLIRWFLWFCRDAEQKQDVSREEVVQILQVIASTGRFWYDLLQYRLFVLRLLVFVIVRDGVCVCFFPLTDLSI